MGVRFPPIQGLVLPHYGAFWSSLRDEFGTSEEAVPLGTFEEIGVTKSGAPLPRTWLIHNDKQYLIQLQQSIFYFNWRKRDDAESYPRYSTIKPLFYTNLGRYVAFLEGEKLPIPKAVDCDLTYVNIIPMGEGGYTRDGFASVFPDVDWRLEAERFLLAPKGISWQATFDLPESAGELTAKVQSAKRASNGLPVVRFELVARNSGYNLPLGDTEDWFDLAHETIVLSFADLTSGEMQRDVWKRIDGTD